jgi:hypothetical protein
VNLLRKARDLESRLAGTFDRTVGDLARSGAREPLEIVHAIVEASLAEVQSSGRGRRVFPFNTIALIILAPSRDARARFDAVFSDHPPLRDRIVAQLASNGCLVEDLEVSIKYDSQPRKQWRHPEFHIEFARLSKPAPKAPVVAPTLPRVELAVVNGVAERRSYVLPAKTRIDIGRCAEVRDSRHRLIRTNHVAFVEGSGTVNQTVSRRHAHISHETPSNSFRVHDDGSEHGTSVMRQGRSFAVPRGTRGVRLESGDEIILGEARVRVKFVAEAPR